MRHTPEPQRDAGPRATVVHIITRLELGGAQENTLYTCAHLDRRRYRVRLAFGPGGYLDEQAERVEDLPLWRIPNLVREIRPRADVRALTDLTALLRQERRAHAAEGLDPHRFIVHTHSSKAGILGRLAAKLAGVPVVIHGIHGFGFHDGQHPAKFAAFLGAERAAARLTHGFFSVSEASLQEAYDRGIVRAHHFARIVRSGMVLDDFRSGPDQRAASRAALGLSKDIEVVLTIANFKPQKDPLTLIEAFAEVARRRPSAVLLFAGDGPLRPAVEAAVEKHLLTNRVRLLGWRRDVPDLLAACDVVALSSIFEGLPRSAVQAVAARRPFVGTNVDGTPEIIRHGENGYLVPPRNASALAEAIDAGLTHRPVDDADEIRVRAWDAERMVRDQEAAYEALLTR